MEQASKVSQSSERASEWADGWIGTSEKKGCLARKTGFAHAHDFWR